MPADMRKERKTRSNDPFFDILFRKRSLFFPVFDLHLRKKLEYRGREVRMKKVLSSEL